MGQNRFLRVWLTIVVLVAGILLIRAQISVAQAPTLSDVLAKESKADKASNAFDPGLLVVSLLGLSVVTLSAAKSVELVQRHRCRQTMAAQDEPKIIIRREDNLERLDALRKESAELSKANSWFKEENSKLKLRVGELIAELEELSRAEKMLKKSSFSLGKEIERLKAENELLMLKVSSLETKESKPKRAVGKAQSKLKAPAKAKKKK
jgi:hypothetical protein